MSEYDDRLREQQAQYATGADIHALPGIFHHWSHRFLAPALRQVFGQASITHVYSSAFAKTLTNGKLRKFVSIGSGDCSQEIEIAKELRAAGHEDFEIIGLEVAENLIAEARAAIQREGLSKQITTRFFDINRDVVDGPVDGFMAHHSLHHIVELERLFDMINAVLVPEGCFATCDMIGRNGHMRWPEALRYVEAAWANLPEAKKFNWQQSACDFSPLSSYALRGPPMLRRSRRAWPRMNSVSDRWLISQAGTTASDVGHIMRCPPPHCARRAVKTKWKKRRKPVHVTHIARRAAPLPQPRPDMDDEQAAAYRAIAALLAGGKVYVRPAALPATSSLPVVRKSLLGGLVREIGRALPRGRSLAGVVAPLAAKAKSWSTAAARG
jgi:SAM-dependent methyltransferase